MQPPSLAELATACRVCTACRLAETRTTVVFGEGDPVARLMIVGEGPGEDEDRSGRPFVGRAGQLLDRILEAAGISRESVFIANMVKCRPPGNRNPHPDEIEACDHWLLDQIRMIRPAIIVTLGNVPTQYFLQTKAGITKTRGVWGEFNRLGFPVRVMPLFHPAYLLRNPVRTPGGPKSLTWRDIREVKAALDGLGSPGPETASE
ncbi:MAG TPA: uracil-DNA glycosylase, partial [Deinococcales bacterium]|nr:uracil-DNA glycosylase [Deinococcales bacterium]